MELTPVSLRILTRRVLSLIEHWEEMNEDQRERLAEGGLLFIDSVKRGDRAVSERSFGLASPADLDAASAVFDALTSSPREAPENASALFRLLEDSEVVVRSLKDGHPVEDSEAVRKTQAFFSVLSEFAVDATSHDFDEAPTTSLA